MNTTFRTRLMAANAAFMSVIIYLIPLWGGTEQYLLKGLQVLQNRAARCVTKQSWYTPTRQLLNQCNWMSVHQLIQYHSILQTHKVLKAQTPLYLSTKPVTDHPYPTRVLVGSVIQQRTLDISVLLRKASLDLPILCRIVSQSK